MNVINVSNKSYLDILGLNIPNKNENHRLLKYLIIENIDNGKAIFNELTRSFIWIPDKQWKNIDNYDIDYIKWLWDNYFIVNESYDEYSAQELLKSYHLNYDDPIYLSNGYIKNYTIFTTMSCNARCSYCYEKGRKQLPMSLETANKVADYIIKSSIKDKQIKLRWFGGEPLIGEKCIDIICQKLKDNNINYASVITSNGFLFKEEKIEKYKNLWNLNLAQITIDGTEDEYNRIKNYKNVKGQNPYQIVMNNIKILSENNIMISLRMNVDINNADNIKILIKELYKKFKNHKNIYPYCYPLFEDKNNNRSNEEWKLLYNKINEIYDTLKKYSYLNPKKLNNAVRATHCMADNGYSVVIGTQGDLGLCEHYSDNHFWGHIDNPNNKNLEEIKAFTEYVEKLDICDDCPIVPSCRKMKLCGDLNKCNVYIRDLDIRNHRERIIIMYNNWIKYVTQHNSTSNNLLSKLNKIFKIHNK